jgi:hypothetical protein
MEEKKLTDEEIVKALENQANGYGAGIVGDLSALTLDLINRQKAEIERLKNEKYKVEQNLEQCENGYELELHTVRFDMRMNREMVAELQKQVEKLTEENKTFLNRSTMWKHLHTEVCEENGQLKGYNSGLEYENAELQKQVDELLRDKGFLIAERTHIKEQAVKNTAKEILAKAPNETNADEMFIHWLRERYGVEVE